MKLLIIQPKLERLLLQLEQELNSHPDVDAVLFPEGYLNENLEQACMLAKCCRVILIGGYRNMSEQPKDRCVIIDRDGEIVLDRIKYSDTIIRSVEGMMIGHLLCDELVLQGIKNPNTMHADLIVHPIGVGMFSEEQFDEWLEAARKIAVTYNTVVIGTSHCDGAYRDSSVCIPISYCFNRNGEEIFISRNNARSFILDTESMSVLTG